MAVVVRLVALYQTPLPGFLSRFINQRDSILAAVKLILASQSPRRSQLLQQLGFHFDIHAADIDEARFESELPEAYVERMCRQKAQTIYERSVCSGEHAILSADTTVVFADECLGKPVDQAQAMSMLRTLSGRQHRVITGICLYYKNNFNFVLNCSEVSFREISDQEISTYWRSGEPADKAGSYAIQGYGGSFVERLEGDYSAVVGLPLWDTLSLLRSVGIQP